MKLGGGERGMLFRRFHVDDINSLFTRSLVADCFVRALMNEKLWLFAGHLSYF